MEVMMKNVVVILFVMACTLNLFSDVINPDKPAKGQWDFELKKIWEIERIGDDLFSRPDEPLVAEDERIYVRDRKAAKNFILDKNGNLIKSFAKKGEGPGEVKLGMESYLTKDNVIIADFERLHFFNRNGKFIKFEKNFFFRRQPAFFLDADHFISRQFNAQNQSDTRGTVKKINLKTGREKVLTEFEIFTGGSIRMEGYPRREVVFVGLSPIMTVGRGDGRLYYGMSDNYFITIADEDGKKLNRFSVKRKAENISNDDKRKLIEGLRNMNDAVFKYLMKNIPNKTTYFYRLESHHGMIYVFIPSPLHRLYPERYNPAGIDIFSPEGKYLYTAQIKLKNGRRPVSLCIAGTTMLMFEETEEGDVYLVKYHISLPGAAKAK
jgi:hypothetical protein